MTSYVSYLFLRCLSYMLNILPLELALWIGRTMGRLAYRVVGSRRRLALRNLKIAFGLEKTPEERAEIAKSTFSNLGMILVEFLRMPKLRIDYHHRYARIEGREHLEQAIKQGKGVIALTFHFGNWEIPALGASFFGYPIVALAQRISNPWIDRYVRRTREAAGVRILPKRNVSQEVIDSLRQGKIVAIFVDQRERKKSRVTVDFFGEKAPVTPSPVVFSLRTGAPMIPLFTIRERKSHHHVIIGSPLFPKMTGELDRDLETNTEAYTKILERMVRDYPDQYFWLHNRWGRKQRRIRRRRRR
ncbi:MAG: hypothetical protein GTN81_04400 [Proteobacteria bacterium]|nr:hypothetical protein [Pseudomonadota bacterium]